MLRPLESACIASTLLGCVINVAFQRALGEDGGKVLKGSRVWSFYAAAFFQGLILPCCIVYAFVQSEIDVQTWLFLPSEAASVIPHAAAIGYFLRDLLWPLPLEMIIHHVVSVALCYTSISGHLPGLPPNMWMLGGFSLGLGSLVANIASVMHGRVLHSMGCALRAGAPAEARVLATAWSSFSFLAAVLMALSNLAGLVVCVYIAVTMDDLPMFTRWINPLVVLPLTILRQQASNAEAWAASRMSEKRD